MNAFRDLLPGPIISRFWDVARLERSPIPNAHDFCGCGASWRVKFLLQTLYRYRVEELH